jgi:transposase, IS5 family
MLRLAGGQVESLWDEVLPGEVRELPEDLAALDLLLRDPVLFEPIAASWQSESLAHGRPTIPMGTYVRLMVVKQRTGWGYETLVREVSDSIHLRRFCLIALGERVPDESTVRKLTRRLGGEVVDGVTRCVIAKATREKRFRPRAVRIDSTVIEADVRYPSDSGLTLDGARTLAREAKRLTVLVGAGAGRVRDRTRAIGRRLRMISKTMGRRIGERKQEVLRLTEDTRTRARSARASWASRTSSGTWCRSARSRRTPSAAHADSSCRPPPSSAARTRPSCSPARSASSTGSGSGRGRSRSMAASRNARPQTRWSRWRPSGCSSLAASSQDPGAPSDDSRDTELAPKAESVTSSAVTGCDGRG